MKIKLRIYILSSILTLMALPSCSSFQPPSVGNSLTDERLAQNTKRQLNTIEQAYTYFVDKDKPGVKGATGRAEIVDRRVIKNPSQRGEWVEAWTVRRRGGTATYRITFTRTPTIGGTSIEIKTPPKLSIK